MDPGERAVALREALKLCLLPHPEDSERQEAHRVRQQMRRDVVHKVVYQDVLGTAPAG